MPALETSQPEAADPQYADIWKAAIKAYKKTSKVPLPSNTPELNSVDDVLRLVEAQEEQFSDFRSKGQVPDLIKSIIGLVKSSTEAAGGGVSLVYPPATAISASIGALFNAAEAVSDGYNTIIEMLESLKTFLVRFEIHLHHDIAPHLKEIIVKFIAQLLTTIGLQIKLIKEGRFLRFLKALIGRHTDVQDALKTLERLSLDESLMVGAVTLEGVNDIKSDIGLMSNGQLRSKIDVWLDAPDPSSNHNAALEKRHQGTGDWFVQGDQFKTWMLSTRSFLWIHGSSGSGKSVLCSTVIEGVRNECVGNSALALAYFYFDFSDPAKHDYRKMLCSLIKQLSWRSKAIPSDLQQLYNRLQDGSQKPTLDDLLTLFKELARPFERTYIVLDALDEYADTVTERSYILSFIETLVGWRFNNVHVLVTSQKPPDIEGRLQLLDCTQLDLKSTGDNVDIKMYIDAILAQDEKLGRWGDEQKRLIRKTLLEQADGIFRWVACQVVELRRCKTRGQLKEALRSLPKDLGETYERMLKRIDWKHDGTYVIMALKWLSFSERPLTLSELAAALRVDRVDGDPVEDDDQVRHPLDVLEECSSLVTISTGEHVNKDDSEVKLAHLSVRDYLTSDDIRKGELKDFWLDPKLSHSSIAQTGLDILVRLDSPDSVDSTIPLARYAAEYWITHYLYGDLTSSEIGRSMRALFQPQSAQFFNWIRLYDIDRPWHPTEEKRPPSTMAPPLYYASYAGLLEISRWLLSLGVDVDAAGGRHSPALHAASYRGHEAIVRLLLENGADIGDEVLHVESAQGHEAVVRLLLEKGVDTGGTALWAASFSGHTAIARLLLENGANVKADIGDYGNTLQVASAQGHETIVRFLLEMGADVNGKDGYFGTALQAASGGGQEAIVRLLLDKGADVNAEGALLGNALKAAKNAGQDGIVQLLLDHGANVKE